MHALMDSVVLQGANHFKAGAVADVRQTRVAVPAEIPLKYSAVFGAIKQGSPGLEFPNATGRFLGVQLCHAPVVDVLPAPHSVRKVDSPVIAIVHIGQSSGYAAFGHHGVRLAQQGLANHSYRYTLARRFNCSTQTGAA